MAEINSISEQELKLSMRNSIWAGAVGVFFFMIVQNGPIPLLLAKMGAGGIAIGLTAALFQLGMLLQIPSAFLSERFSNRKLFWAATSISARAILAVPGVFLLVFPESNTSATWLILAAIGSYSFIAQMSSPSWFSWMADLVPESMRPGFWSRRQGAATISAVVSVAMTGWLLDLFPENSLAGFGWLLIFAALVGILDIIIHWFVHDPGSVPADRGLSATRRVMQPLKNRDFCYFTLSMCIWYFGLGFFGPFLNVYLKSTFGVTYTHLSAIQLAGMVSSVVSSYVGGRLINRTGLRTYGLAMVVMIPVFSIVWFFLDGNATGLLPLLGRVPQPVMMLCFSSLLAGGVFAAVGMLQLNLLSALSPKEGRTMAMAVHWTLVGALSAAGPVVGGWVKDWFTAYPTGILLYAGTELSYFQVMVLAHNAMIWFMMLPLLMKISKRDGEWPLEQAVTDIFVLTPLRAVRNVYNFNIAASTVAVNTVKETASAAGKIAARATVDTGTIALQAVKETFEAAGRAGRQSLEKEVKKLEEKKNAKTHRTTTIT